MELLINIDEDMYKRICEAQSVPDMYGTDIVNALNSIREGMPHEEIPKDDAINQSSRIDHNVYDGYICNYGIEYPNHYMIMPEALKISDNMQVPIAYTSDNSLPEFIGSAEIESDSCGILAHCQFSDNYAGLIDLLKSGKYDLGFTAIDVEYTTDDSGVRHYTQGIIRNISVLPYPYNPRRESKDK